MNGIDLFSGAGGMSFGASMAGIKTKFAIDIDLNSANTFKYNFPKVKFSNSNILQLNPQDFSSIKPFVIYGGPPCQGFSISNTRDRKKTNPKNSLFKSFVKFVKVLKPTWFVFENVEGITSLEKGEFLKMVIKKFEDLNYTTKYSILCASDYGVPQNRNRFFLIGNNKNKIFNFPDSLNMNINVQDAINDLPSLKNGDRFLELPYKSNDLNDYTTIMRKDSSTSTQNFVSRNKDYVIERYSYIKPGENWKSIPEELMENYKNTNNCHSGIYKRLDPNLPSVVIANYRKNMLIHPTEDRGLSVREAARLQSFPDSFLFQGTLGSIQQQIGNAVPPLLSFSIFKQIVNG